MATFQPKVLLCRQVHLQLLSVYIQMKAGLYLICSTILLDKVGLNAVGLIETEVNTTLWIIFRYIYRSDLSVL